MYDINKIRKDFPILQTSVYGKPLVYLDSGATAQKPLVVTETISRIHNHLNANVHRGVHYLSEQCTEEYEAARETIRAFINAPSTKEIVFTASTTAAINLVASSFGDAFVSEGDEIITTEMEHHSNLVPWQMLCKRKKATLKVVPFDDEGNLDLSRLAKLLSSKTKLLAVTHVSNTLGTVNPIKQIVALAHQHNVPVLVDGAQGIVHSHTDVQEMDCDFYAFSGHKLYGPTGIGVLYAKEKWLEAMPPYQYGGEMVATVSIDKATFAELPLKFEAGTPNYIGAIGLASAIAYIQGLGLANIQQHEQRILALATAQAAQVDGMTVYGKAKHKAGILSFLLDGVHHYDAGMILDKMGIAVRTGQLCTEPLLHGLGISGVVRASFALYTSEEDIEALFKGITKVKMMFS